MRLLTLPVTIVRVPLELGFGAAKEAVKLVHGLVGGGEETVVEEPRPKPAPRKAAPRRKPAARRSTNGRSGKRAAETTPPGAATERPTPSAPAPERPAPPAPTTERPAPRAPAAAAPPEPVAPEPAAAVRAAAEAAAAEAAAAAEPASEPANVSEEPELVSETAEAGAEDGAGAEVAVGEPWPGYDDMQAADIEDRLLAEGAEAAAAVSLYEASRKGRASVLEAASRKMVG